MSSCPATRPASTRSPAILAWRRRSIRIDVIEQVVEAYGVDWVVVTRPAPGQTDPLGLWNGAAATDITGAHPSFLGPDPAYEHGDLRIFRVPEAAGP